MTRHCGDCQLCCRILPVGEIGKPALTRCGHQCRAGCGIYEHRPKSCQAFSCVWLQGHDCGPRPDRLHMVIDPMPDYVRSTDNVTGVETKMVCYQVWIDPYHPTAHRHAGFREWLNRQAMPALIRIGSDQAYLVVPPSACAEREWLEFPTHSVGEPEHTAEERVEALRGAGWDMRLV